MSVRKGAGAMAGTLDQAGIRTELGCTTSTEIPQLDWGSWGSCSTGSGYPSEVTNPEKIFFPSAFSIFKVIIHIVYTLRG